MRIFNDMRLGLIVADIESIFPNIIAIERDVGSDPQPIKLLVEHLDTRAWYPLLLVPQDRDVLLKLMIDMRFRFLQGSPQFLRQISDLGDIRPNCLPDFFS